MSPTPSASAFALVALFGFPAVAASPTAPHVVTGFESPESVLIAGDLRYVSNIGARPDPTGKDGDGYISELAADGSVLVPRAFPADGTTLDAPKGMAMAGGRLYVADIDRVVGFDPESRAQVSVADLPHDGPTLANDLAVVDDEHLLVTETLGGAVWELDLGSGRFTLVTDATPGANGIVYDPATRRAVVVALGADFTGGDIFRVTLDGSAEPVPSSPHGIFDGIARDADGRLVVSDWISIDPPTAGRFLTLAADGAGPAEPLDLGQPIVGPADFTFDPNGALWIPAMSSGEVMIIPR